MIPLKDLNLRQRKGMSSPMITVQITEELTERQLGPSGFFKWFKNYQGLQLGTYFWPVDAPKGVVFLIHGHGIHTEHSFLKHTKPGEPVVYKGSWVERLNQDGLYVCGIDNQSCGRSEGIVEAHRCYFDAFDDIVRDTEDFISWVKNDENFGLSKMKSFILGGSAGGCVAVHAAHRNPDLCSGLILLAPMLSLEKVGSKGLNYYLKPLAPFFSWLLPYTALASTNKNVMFPEVQEFYDKDPACWHGNTRIRVASEFLRATDWVVKEMKNMEFPFLCIHSSDDTMCDLEGSKQLYEQSKATDKSLDVISKMWHVLVHEPGCEQILEKVLKWLRERVQQ